MDTTIIYGIAYECPFGKRKNSCPCCEIEQLSFEEKVDWIECLREKRKYLIVESHRLCLKRRENKISL